MSEKDKIISEVYYDQAGFGSIATTYKDAKKKDASITMQDVKEWLQAEKTTVWIQFVYCP